VIHSIAVKKLHSGAANEILKKGLFEIVLASVTKSFG